MAELKIITPITPRAPVLIAAWPGIGNVAIGAINHLRKSLDTVAYAEILVPGAAVIDSVEVDHAVAHFAPAPKHVFYYAEAENLLIFESEAQLPGPEGVSIASLVVDIARRFSSPWIYTAAAFPALTNYHDPAEIYGVVNKESLRGDLTQQGIKLMEEGTISGLNGLLLGLAAKRNINALCLLATMPYYAISFPNPKASAAIVEAFGQMLKRPIDIHELLDASKDLEERMASFEDKVKEVIATEGGRGGARTPPAAADKKIPASIMERIEKLFFEARGDRTKALILKRELDRWDLYALYEDRFLDLFRENQ